MSSTDLERLSAYFRDDVRARCRSAPDPKYSQNVVDAFYKFAGRMYDMATDINPVVRKAAITVLDDPETFNKWLCANPCFAKDINIVTENMTPIPPEVFDVSLVQQQDSGQPKILGVDWAKPGTHDYSVELSKHFGETPKGGALPMTTPAPKPAPKAPFTGGPNGSGVPDLLAMAFREGTRRGIRTADEAVDLVVSRAHELFVPSELASNVRQLIYEYNKWANMSEHGDTIPREFVLEAELEKVQRAHRAARTCLGDALDVLRSAYSICLRDGKETNWESFRARVLLAVTQTNDYMEGAKPTPAKQEPK